MGSTAKGEPHGLATLDGTGKIPVAQIPAGGGVTPGDAVADVATADADATYGQPEADLLNEVKDQLNATLASLRAAGLLET